MIHKKTPNKIRRIQNEYNDGTVQLVVKTEITDEFGTPLPSQSTAETLGSYPFRIVGIHSADVYHFQSLGVKLDLQIRIPLIHGIDSAVTAKIKDKYYNIEKTYKLIEDQELELLLGEERSYL